MRRPGPSTARSGRGLAVCCLISGGLDSAVLLARLLAAGERVIPCFLRCGLTWEPTELYWLRRLLRAMRSTRLLPLQVVELPLASVYGNHWSVNGRGVPRAGSAEDAVYLPGRNVLLLSVAGVVCARQRLSAVALGILKGNPFRDASPRFLEQFAVCLRHALNRPMRILTPLRALRKSEVIRAAAGVPLHLTYSCMNPTRRHHCGRCNKCAERMRAFREAGVDDPTTYAA